MRALSAKDAIVRRGMFHECAPAMAYFLSYERKRRVIVEANARFRISRKQCEVGEVGEALQAARSGDTVRGSTVKTAKPDARDIIGDESEK